LLGQGKGEISNEEIIYIMGGWVQWEGGREITTTIIRDIYASELSQCIMSKLTNRKTRIYGKARF
jgi:hypothetical protein